MTKITGKKKEALESWTALNKNINSFTEKELRTMLRYEFTNENRSAFIKRLKQKIIGVHLKLFKTELDKVKGDSDA